MSEITKNQVKLIRSLQQKKYRQQTGLFVVEGIKNVEELIKSQAELLHLYATHSNHSLKNATLIGQKELRQMSALSSPDGILAVTKIQPRPTPEIAQTFTLVLDQINDPGNLGTIIRTAHWFGIKNIICSPNTVDCYNPKTVQATKGSIFHVNVSYTDLKTWLSAQKLPIYGARLNGKPFDPSSLSPNSILIMGSESHGISKEIEPFIHQPILIPRYGHAESLNVGIATGILLHEFAKLIE